MKYEIIRAKSGDCVDDVLMPTAHLQASGVFRQIVEVDPQRVRIWSGNPRNYEKLTHESTVDLIEGIKAEGGQKIPALVRRVYGDNEYDYEVIAGSRRHFAISWLRANGYPELNFIAIVECVTDEKAFRLTELENRNRKDVTDLERAKSYAYGLNAYYLNQLEMAAALGISRTWLSKHLSVAAMPEAIFAAFPSESDIQVKPVYPVAQKWRVPKHRAALIEKAVQLAGEQRRRVLAAEKPITSKQVVQALLSVAEEACQRKSDTSSTLIRTSTIVGDVWQLELQIDRSVSQTTYLKELRKLFASHLKDRSEKQNG